MGSVLQRLGELAMQPHFRELTPSQAKLVDIYVQRSLSSTASSAPGVRPKT